MLDRKTYVVKERPGVLKLVDTYDLLDPDTGQPIGIAKEEPPGITKYLRLLGNNSFFPTQVNVYEREGDPPILTIDRGFTLFRAKVIVRTRERELGYGPRKMLTLGKTFHIFDRQDHQIGRVQGAGQGGNVPLLTPAGEGLGRVTKKWAGLARELFTTADTYVIALSDSAAGRRDVAQLLLAAGLAIDTVFKEKDE